MAEREIEEWNDPDQDEFGNSISRLRQNIAMTPDEKVARLKILQRELKKLNDARDEFRHRMHSENTQEA